MKRLVYLVLCALALALALPAVSALAEATEADFVITLTADAATVNAGQKVTLTAAFADPETVNKTAKNDTIIWTLTDADGNKTKAASIGKNGVVTTQKTVKEKTVVVATATAKAMQSQTASVEITIVPLVSKLTVLADTSILYLQDGYDTVRLNAGIEPADASGDVTWKSSNEDVVTVDENGLATAVSMGTATVTATATDGSKKSGNVKLTVGVPVGMLDSIDFSGSTGNCLKAGKGSITFSVKEFFDAEGNPITPTDKNITWSIRVEPESAQQFIAIDEKGKLTASGECPPASVEVIAAADGALPAGSATYKSEPILVVPVSAADPVETESIEDFYGKWSLFMTVDAKGKADSAYPWLKKHKLNSIEFEIVERNGKPCAMASLDHLPNGGLDVCLKDGALYKDEGNGEGGEKRFELCADGTMIQYAVTSNLDPDIRLYCVRTSSEKQIVDTQSDEADGSVVLLGDLRTRDIYGKIVDGGLIADRKLVRVNVWATYCQPCIREMEGLGNLGRELEDQGVAIVGVVIDCQNSGLSTNEKQLKAARKIVESTKADYPHLLPSQAMFSDFVYQIQSIPTTFFVDGSGRMVGKVYVGSREEADWRQIISDTLANPEPVQAEATDKSDLEVLLEAVTEETGGIPDSIDGLADRYDLEKMKKMFDIQPLDILDTLTANGSCSFPSLGCEWPSGWIYYRDGEEFKSFDFTEDNMQISDDQVTITLDEAAV